MPLFRALVPAVFFVIAMATPSLAWASNEPGHAAALTSTGFGYASILIFLVAYAMVIGEERLHIRKSMPVLVGGGLIWLLIGVAMARMGDHETAEAAVRHFLLEFGELFLFLLSAMTFINTMEERHVFARLRAALVSRHISYRGLFWATGALAFPISAIADNLTTALLMAAVIRSVGVGRPRFIALASVNLVVAANAGGAFSPFGDITTLMVWQKGQLQFGQFFILFVPSLVNWLVPAIIMSFAVEKGTPAPVDDKVEIKRGGVVVTGLLVGTVATAVLFHSWLHLPPVLGMVTGLGILKAYGHYLSREPKGAHLDEPDDVFARSGVGEPVDIYKQLERAEWDTLMFFCGVILCVGGLGTLGYLAMLSHSMYGGLGPTVANVAIGVVSALVDNIPIMVAVLDMNPQMSEGQWLLVTLTAGVGGSLLSVGSAAGVGLMGQMRGVYTFNTHLRWTWAIALGYAASIGTHLLLNRATF